MFRSARPMVIVVLLVGCAGSGRNPAPPAASTTEPTTAAESATVATSASAPGVAWRKGLVVEVGDRSAFGPPIDGDCRASATMDAERDRRYVEVRYFVGRHAHLRIVPIDDALHVAAGDVIWFRSVGCVDARLAAPDR